MSDFDFAELEPRLKDVIARFSESEDRLMRLKRKKYDRQHYIFCSDLLPGDVVRVELPELETEGIQLAPARTLIGVASPTIDVTDIVFDSANVIDSLVDQAVILGGWGNLNYTTTGGYFPTMLSHGFAFGYHLAGEDRFSAQNLLTPYSALSVNSVSFFDASRTN